MEKTSREKAPPAHVSEGLVNKRCWWEGKRSHVLTGLVEETSRMKTAGARHSRGLDNERRQWQEEKSCLLESIRTIQKPSNDKEGIRSCFMEKLVNMGPQMDDTQRKKLKTNQRKRFPEL